MACTDIPKLGVRKERKIGGGGEGGERGQAVARCSVRASGVLTSAGSRSVDHKTPGPYGVHRHPRTWNAEGEEN